MAVPLQPWTRNILPTPEPAPRSPETVDPLLTIGSAWTSLRHRTGIPLARATFYRWVSSGKIYSLRMGLKVYIPSSVIEGIVRQCKSGDAVWHIGE
ncbi:MAG: hypothetical protein ACRD06_02640 [Terriglobia bacterium]